MAEKISTLAIKVDLGCHCCYKKIQKTLCKLQERENIETISYDEKNNIVKISGPFDPQKLSKKLRCKACKVIIEIMVVVPPNPPPEPKQEETIKIETIHEVINDIQIIVKDHSKDPKSTSTKKEIKESAPKKSKEAPSKADPKEKKTTYIETTNKVINDIKIIVENDPKEPPPPQPPVCQVCFWMACSVAHQGGSRCYSCGRIYGCASDGPPMVYGGTSYGGCRLTCEEDPCTVM